MASKRKVQNRPVKRQGVYVDGNTVRKVSTAPKTGVQPHTTAQTRKKSALRREKALPMNFASVAILATAAVATLVICVKYLELQSEITYRLKNINALETQLADLRSQNDELDKRVNSYIDLNYIYKVATEEMGMAYATEEQIAIYHDTGSEYIRQYGSIPEVKKGIGSNGGK